MLAPPLAIISKTHFGGVIDANSWLAVKAWHVIRYA